MRVLDGEQLLARIFVGEENKWHHVPLYRALLERLRREGFAGTTVIHGVAGFGAASVIHTTNIVDLSGDLPIFDRDRRRPGAHGQAHPHPRRDGHRGGARHHGEGARDQVSRRSARCFTAASASEFGAWRSSEGLTPSRPCRQPEWW